MNAEYHRKTSLTLGFLALLFSSVMAGDWPMWRHDALRTAVTNEPLPQQLHVRWVRRFVPLQPAYHTPRLQFDRGYEPVVLGKTLFVGSSANDSLSALDTDTGAQKWRFHAEGPVRFAPVAWREKVYFGADDGHLYCLNARNGKLVWKFRAVPSDRKLLGNRRLISVWPVRGGPVLKDGIIYFAAGVWSFEGVFVYALNAKTGDVIWRNDRASFVYGVHPHKTEALGGLTPQGYLLIEGNDLIVPCGTAYPARFDLATGDLKSFQLPAPGRLPGGWFVAVTRQQRRGDEPPSPVGLTFDLAVNAARHEGGDEQGTGHRGVRDVIQVGDRQFPFPAGLAGVSGSIHTMLAADGKLFLTTLEGAIYCFGHEVDQAQHYLERRLPLGNSNNGSRQRVQRTLAATGTQHGYALVLGVGSGQLLAELAAQSRLNIIAVEPDGTRADTLRRRLDQAGLYGQRITILTGHPLRCGLPPYFASLITSEDPRAADITWDGAAVKRLFHLLRPFGGTACFSLDTAQSALFRQSIRDTQTRLPNAQVTRTGELVCLTRAGALPGTTDYTGGWQPSPDEQVRAPLGVLWFDDTVGHFKRSPQPMFVDGVMRSLDKEWMGYPAGDRPPYRLSTTHYTDVYTGRVLSADEIAAVAEQFPPTDLGETQPEQYRPPTQTDPWRPEPPRPGQRVNPLTGQAEPRVFPKNYGCDGGFDYGHLYTMRSATAAFYDKRVESGTVYVSGPRSGCTNSVIPANGLLNVPYFYKGCTCSYPLPAALALVNMPPTYEQWAVWGNTSAEPVQQAQRVGVNFGAPGDRMSPAGTLWIDYPSIGGPSPRIALRTVPDKPRFYYRHSLWIESGRGWPWVAASGAEGLSQVVLEGLRSAQYTVRLYFAEPRATVAGQRVFDVLLQGQPVLDDFDIFNESGGTMRALVKEFKQVPVEGRLSVEFPAKAGTPLISGIELVADDLPLDPIPALSSE